MFNMLLGCVTHQRGLHFFWAGVGMGGLGNLDGRALGKCSGDKLEDASWVGVEVGGLVHAGGMCGYISESLRRRDWIPGGCVRRPLQAKGGG